MSPGLLLQDKYRLQSELGEGGMGRVWRARDLRLDAPVAVKLLHSREERNPASLARFEREAKAAASLRSPHVVQILDYGIDATTNVQFIVMELLEGESLKARLERAGRLPFDEVCRVVTHVARALARAHAAAVIHRDLKPANIFLVHNGDVEIAKVLDFGIAKWAQSPLSGGSTETGVFMGTPAYMSPEQILSAKSVDYRADLWSLAIIAAECLTGSLPFHSDNLPGLALAISQGRFTPPSQLGRVPQGFDAWFERAVASNPTHRFESAAVLAQQLAALRGAPEVGVTAAQRREDAKSGVSSSPLSNTAPAPRRSQHRSKRWAVGASLLCCTLLGWLGLRQSGSAPGVAVAELRGPLTRPLSSMTPEPESAAQLPPAPALPVAPTLAELPRPVVAPVTEPPQPRPQPTARSEPEHRPLAAPPAPAGTQTDLRRTGTPAPSEPDVAPAAQHLSRELQPWPEEPVAVISVAATGAPEASGDGLASLAPAAAHELLAINPSVPPFRATLPGPYLAPGKRYTASVRVCVDEDGAVTNVRIVRPSVARLDFQLRNVIPRWRYRPYLVDGIRTPFCYALDYTVSSSSR